MLSHLRVIAQLLRTVRLSGRLWLLPVVVILGLLGLVLAGFSAAPLLTPFIYALI